VTRFHLHFQTARNRPNGKPRILPSFPFLFPFVSRFYGLDPGNEETEAPFSIVDLSKLPSEGTLRAKTVSKPGGNEQAKKATFVSIVSDAFVSIFVSPTRIRDRTKVGKKGTGGPSRIKTVLCSQTAQASQVLKSSNDLFGCFVCKSKN
jgi:hypothetical protein